MCFYQWQIISNQSNTSFQKLSLLDRRILLIRYLNTEFDVKSLQKRFAKGEDRC